MMGFFDKLNGAPHFHTVLRFYFYKITDEYAAARR